MWDQYGQRSLGALLRAAGAAPVRDDALVD